MFDLFRSLFVLHEDVAHDWAIEHAFAEGQLIARVCASFREAASPSPAAEALYEGILEAVAEGEPDVALAFTVELERRLATPLDPTGIWRPRKGSERVGIVPRRDSDHPHDYWVVKADERSARGAAARFVPGSGVLAFSRSATLFDAPWALLPGGPSGQPPMWVKASAVRTAEALGWRLGEAWVAPEKVRQVFVIAESGLSRTSGDPGDADLAALIDALTG